MRVVRLDVEGCEEFFGTNIGLSDYTEEKMATYFPKETTRITTPTPYGCVTFKPFMCPAIDDNLDSQSPGGTDQQAPFIGRVEGKVMIVAHDCSFDDQVYIMEEEEFESQEAMDMIIRNHFSWLSNKVEFSWD